MPYLSYVDQLRDHITFLQDQGFDITEPAVDAGFVRCHKIGESKGFQRAHYHTKPQPRACKVACWGLELGVADKQARSELIRLMGTVQMAMSTYNWRTLNQPSHRRIYQSMKRWRSELTDFGNTAKRKASPIT